MYNGIGITTPRGSGTNGYAQANKFLAKPKPNKIGRLADVRDGSEGIAGAATAAMRPPSKDILEHNRKRAVGVKLAVLEDQLIDHGYDAAEIASRLAEARRTVEGSAESVEKKQGF